MKSDLGKHAKSTEKAVRLIEKYYGSKVETMRSTHGVAAFDVMSDLLNEVLRDLGRGCIPAKVADMTLRAVGQHTRELERELLGK
jgi:hypothetical protein